jgi:hypothetical protein
MLRPNQEAQLRDWRVFEANMYWKTTFFGSPYTTLWMIKYLLEKGNKTWGNLLKNPKILSETFSDDDTLEKAPDLDEISSKPGVCSSFAIQVVNQLESTYEGKFNFQFYKLGGHRVALCKNTGVLIDSRSSCGARRLSKGKSWKTFDGQGKWRFEYAEDPAEPWFERLNCSPDVRLAINKLSVYSHSLLTPVTERILFHTSISRAEHGCLSASACKMD